MEVIIENVILDNFTMDYLLLFFTNKINNCPNSKINLVLASLWGTGFSLISPVIHLSGALWITIKIVFALTMLFIALNSFCKILQRFFTFLFLTFCFGGAMYGIFYFAGVDVTIGSSIEYYSEIPIAFLFSMTIVLGISLYCLLKNLAISKKFSQFCVNVDLSIRNKSVNLRGFIDTGNTLHNENGKPIVIIDEKELKNWFNVSERVDIMLHKYKNILINNAQIVELKTVGSVNKLFVFDADYLRINNRQIDVAIGVNTTHNLGNKNFDIILNNELVGVYNV